MASISWRPGPLHEPSRSPAEFIRTLRDRVAAFGGGALIGTLGGLIGLGGAEFRLPLLIGAFGFGVLDVGPNWFALYIRQACQLAPGTYDPIDAGRRSQVLLRFQSRKVSREGLNSMARERTFRTTAMG